MENNMSPADFSALMGNQNGFGGNNAWWVIILFLFMANGWNRGNDFNNATSQQILFGQRFSSLDNKIDRIGNGLADVAFNINNSIHTAQDTVAGAVVNEGRGLQQQIGDGFCGTYRNIDGLRSDMALMKGDIIGAIHADGEKTRAMIQENTIQNLRDRIQTLEGDARMCGVVRYPMQSAYSAPNPFCNCNCG